MTEALPLSVSYLNFCPGIAADFQKKFSGRNCEAVNEVWGKVMFLHLSEILFTGGGGVCPIACRNTPAPWTHPTLDTQMPPWNTPPWTHKCPPDTPLGYYGCFCLHRQYSNQTTDILPLFSMQKISTFREDIQFLEQI